MFYLMFQMLFTDNEIRKSPVDPNGGLDTNDRHLNVLTGFVGNQD
jgi:hypothetical protein